VERERERERAREGQTEGERAKAREGERERERGTAHLPCPAATGSMRVHLRGPCQNTKAFIRTTTLTQLEGRAGGGKAPDPSAVTSAVLLFQMGAAWATPPLSPRPRPFAPVRRPRSAQPPREPTHLLGHAARADSALRRRRPATVVSRRFLFLVRAKSCSRFARTISTLAGVGAAERRAA
jgi:hypothetical protein